MKNLIQRGKQMTWTNSTGSDVSSGQVVVVGGVVCVASTDIADGETGELATEEVYDLSKATGAITQGASLYWDADGDPVGGTAGSGALTTTSTDNTYAGKAWAAAASGDLLVNIKINA
ncbi:MAG: DUF2190 family protein [Proteobacteria bacterium]|nr:DUF2190 family protein [Pseudomonadota bacterium]MBU1611398.1 DUF2190 family protein [Pseudomonadota bacterium]